MKTAFPIYCIDSIYPPIGRLSLVFATYIRRFAVCLSHLQHTSANMHPSIGCLLIVFAAYIRDSPSAYCICSMHLSVHRLKRNSRTALYPFSQNFDTFRHILSFCLIFATKQIVCSDRI